MRITLWPKANPWSILRSIILLGILAVCLFYCYVVYSFDGKGFAGAITGIFKTFNARAYESLSGKPHSTEPLQVITDAKYSTALFVELSLVDKYLKYNRANGKLPKDVSLLTAYGFDPVDVLDPWHRPYKIRPISRQYFIIQSTGPSGADRVSGEEGALLQHLGDKSFFTEEDNIVVVGVIPTN